MKKEMMAYCGTYCETCEWKEKTGCKGCKTQEARMFWGTCKVASCAIARNIAHCGECGELPCALLREAFDNPEHGDNGERLANLKNWKNGVESTLKVTRIGGKEK